MRKSHAFNIEHWQKIAILMIIYDTITIAFSYFFGLLLRFDFKFSAIPTKYLSVYYKTIIPYALFCIVVYWFTKMYKSVWRFASYNELIRTIISSLGCSVSYIFAIFVFHNMRKRCYNSCACTT